MPVARVGALAARFRDLGMNPSEIRLTGGGSQSPAWRQMAADAFGVPVVTLSTAEGAGLGAAIQTAFTVLGSERSYADLCGQLVAVDESSRCVPAEAEATSGARRSARVGGGAGWSALAGFFFRHRRIAISPASQMQPTTMSVVR